MFKIKFGTVFALMGLIAIIVFYGNFGSGYVEVNGVMVPQDEFSGMLFPLICMGIFVAVGVGLMISGFMEVKRNRETEKLGRETYGIVTNVIPTGAYKNNKAQYKAEILLADENGDIRKFEDIIGFDPFKVQTGQFYKLKYYKNDFNFVDWTPVFMRDQELSQKLLDEYQKYSSTNKFVINESSNKSGRNGTTEFVDPDEYIENKEI